MRNLTVLNVTWLLISPVFVIIENNAPLPSEKVLIYLFYCSVVVFGFIIHDRLICCTEVLLLENDSRLVINLFKFGRWEGEQLALSILIAL